MDPTNATVGALISVGIGSGAMRVVVVPVAVPAKTIRASLFSDTSIELTKPFHLQKEFTGKALCKKRPL